MSGTLGAINGHQNRNIEAICVSARNELALSALVIRHPDLRAV